MDKRSAFNVQCDTVSLYVISSKFWPLEEVSCPVFPHCCAARPALLSSRTGAAEAGGLLVMVRHLQIDRV